MYISAGGRLIFLILFSLFSCSKKNENVVVEGKIVLSVKVKHHSVPVNNLPVYLKFNVSTFPGTDSSNYSVRLLTDGNGEVNFPKCTPGTHYLYAYGFDANAGENVIGYQPVTINASTILNDTTKTDLFVSE
jgi:hypothetical protein